MTERIFHHWIFGNIKVYSDGFNVYYPARACARRLLYVRPSKVLISTGAVPPYSAICGHVSSDVVVDARHVWLLFRHFHGLRKLLADMMYKWLYDTIYPIMMEGRA